jgi:peptidyl-prolyl cis-trans isomerase SurA
MTQKLVSYEVKSKVSVSPGEVNEYYKKNSQDFMQEEKVKLQHILIRTSTHSEEEAKELATRIAQEANSGAAFEELAKKYSEGAEAKEGGEMGWVEKGQLLGEIDKNVFSLEAGQITAPIMSSLGFHIFKVLEKTSLSIRPLSEVRGDIQDRIFKEKLKERLETWMQSLKKNAYISIR